MIVNLICLMSSDQFLWRSPTNKVYIWMNSTRFYLSFFFFSLFYFIFISIHSEIPVVNKCLINVTIIHKCVYDKAPFYTLFEITINWSNEMPLLLKRFHTRQWLRKQKKIFAAVLQKKKRSTSFQHLAFINSFPAQKDRLFCNCYTFYVFFLALKNILLYPHWCPQRETITTDV